MVWRKTLTSVNHSLVGSDTGVTQRWAVEEMEWSGTFVRYRGDHQGREDWRQWKCPKLKVRTYSNRQQSLSRPRYVKKWQSESNAVKSLLQNTLLLTTTAPQLSFYSSCVLWCLGPLGILFSGLYNFLFFFPKQHILIKRKKSSDANELADWTQKACKCTSHCDE